MEIARNNRIYERQETTKTCSYPGCENIFIGKGNSKLCSIHKGKKIKGEQGGISIINPHGTIIVCLAVCGCCGNTFPIEVFPRRSNQDIEKGYPLYCPKHRNEYKRSLHLERDQES